MEAERRRRSRLRDGELPEGAGGPAQLAPAPSTATAEGVLALQRAAGNRAAAGLLAVSRQPAAPVKAATLAERVRQEWDTSHDKGRVFDLLRKEVGERRANRDMAVDAETERCVRAIFAADSDDCWLAVMLNRHGPEPLWPPDALDQRAKREAKWIAGGHFEAGNIEGDVVDPDPDPGGTRIPPVKVYMFPGREPSRRALIIGGVHGNEPQGAEVVERLRNRMAAAKQPPLFTTFLVPTLIERTAEPPKTVPKVGKVLQKGPRNVREKAARPDGGEIEPNRNFPLPGTSYKQARELGAKEGTELRTPSFDDQGNPVPKSTPHPPPLTDKDKDGKDKPVPLTSVNMLPETRVLITLLERYRPERIASVHAHSLKSTAGDAPGIFVDPRADDPATAQDETAQDDKLTQDMLAFARGHAKSPDGKFPTDPFVGNKDVKGSPNVHYASSAHVEGVSLGMYGPVAVPGVRPAATTVTIEVPQWDFTKQHDDLDAIMDAHAQALEEVFLGR